MDEIREGMKVVDDQGDELGTVKGFRAGDPQAVTTDGQEQPGGDSIVDHFLRAFDDAEIDEQRRARMLRIGYVAVDARGLRSDFAVEADRIARIEHDTVYLSPA